MHHADVEEVGELPVDHLFEAIVLPFAMILRRLHEGDVIAFEIWRETAQSIAAHDVIAVDHTDDLRVDCGLSQREIERAGFVAVPLAERGAVIGHQLLTQPRIGGVDDDPVDIAILGSVRRAGLCRHETAKTRRR